MSQTTPPTEEERAELRERNLVAFRERFPELTDMLEDYTPLSELVFNDKGHPDMLFESHYFYDGDIEKYVDEHLERYFEHPTRIFNPALQPTQFDRYTNDYLNTLLQRTAVEKGITFSTTRSDSGAYYLVVYGIGLAAHLDPLVEELDSYVLILFEPNLESLYHSLDVYDWADLIDRLEAKKGALYINIEQQPDNSVQFIRWRMRQSNIVSVDGMYLHIHYNNPIFVNMQNSLLADASLIAAGLGFYYDESIMMENVHRSFYDGTARVFYKQDNPRQDIPAVIVGCGPSLDRDIEHIKRIADKAVIFSSGSALGPLLAHGIKPQFQLELENIEVLIVLQRVLGKYDLSDICLVCSSTVDPDITEYFDRIIYHFRDGLSTYPLFSDNQRHTIPHHDPTVVNASLAFAQQLGFREYYFFGTDMGTKDPSRHHANDSYHEQEDAIVGDRNFSIEIPGNFGGKAYTTDGLFWALNQMERAVRMLSLGYNYYNCSDGCMIETTQPMLARNIELPEPEVSPADHVQQIYEASPVYTREEFDAAWDDDRIADGINETLDKFVDLMSNVEDFRGKDYISEFSVLTNFAVGRRDKSISMVFRGTLHMTLMCFEYYLARVQGGEDQVRSYMEIGREEFLKLVELLREDSLKKLGSLTQNAVKERSKPEAS